MLFTYTKNKTFSLLRIPTTILQNIANQNNIKSIQFQTKINEYYKGNKIFNLK